MSKYTPGPWRLGDSQRDVLALKIKRICEVPGYGVISTGVDKANARLIAAAPDLLNALEEIVESARECQVCEGSGLALLTNDDACSECGGTGEYAVVATIPDLRALIADARKVLT